MLGSHQKAVLRPERMKVWIRSAGRCAVCGRYLLEGQLTQKEATLGELAHLVGQQTTEGSPRREHPCPSPSAIRPRTSCSSVPASTTRWIAPVAALEAELADWPVR